LSNLFAIRNLPAKRIDIVAHSFGGVTTCTALQQFRNGGEYIIINNCIFFVFVFF